MATPFEIHRSPLSPAVALATTAQLGFIGRLADTRDWKTAPDAYVRRVATIVASITAAEMFAADPAAADKSPASISDPTDLAGTFCQVMTYTADQAQASGDAERIGATRTLTKQGASTLIDWLQGRPGTDPRPAAGTNTYGPDTYRAPTSPVWPGTPSADVVPEGRYAVETEDGATNALAFYKIDRPTEGRWAGRVFVKLITGGDEQRLSWPTSKAVLAKIAAVGAESAMLRYGREIGNCGHCGRQLTNDVSRELGIGPVCRQNMGW
jgi:hypothetical protein